MRLRAVVTLLAIAAAGCAPVGTVARPAGGYASRGAVGSTPAIGAAREAIRISLTATGSDRWTVRAGVLAASRVELAGDFSDWDPVPLVQQRAGTWAVDVRLRPGVHQLALRVDGGAWTVPAGLATVTDEFGGVAGVLVVPPAGDPEGRRGSPPGEGRN